MRRDQAAHEILIPMLAELIGAESYLEFGTHLNQTIARVACARRYGVDLEPLFPTDMDSPMNGVTLYKMTTGEFILNHAAASSPYDLVFIDADHRAEAVRADFSGILPYVSPEGLVCLHDTNPETIDDCADDLCSNSWMFSHSAFLAGHEAVTLNFHPGLTIVRNRRKWGPEVDTLLRTPLE
jgi:hypothetical protein